MDLSKEQQRELMNCVLDMGEMLLDSGGEISRVEDTLNRMLRAYGAARAEVFVITSIISVSMEFPGHTALTETRRIRSAGATDFTKLEKLNALSRSCCAAPMTIEALRARLDHIAEGFRRFRVILAGSVLAAGAFALFFGGTVWDGLAAAVFAVFICLLQRWMGKTAVNPTASYLIISLLAGLCVGLITALVPALHMDKILIGDIMLLIPGLAMTNAIRNMLLGNTISGLVRLAESLIWAGALAGGFMVALLVVDVLL